MKRAKELKIFRKTSIEYLKNIYRKSVEYVFDKESWRSKDPETYGKSKILLHTRKSLKKLGNEMNIFKAPSMVGIKIIYNKSLSYLFDSSSLAAKASLVSEDNYLLRDLSQSKNSIENSERELKIFKFLNIESLEKLYFKNKK